MGTVHVLAWSDQTYFLQRRLSIEHYKRRERLKLILKSVGVDVLSIIYGADNPV